MVPVERLRELEAYEKVKKERLAKLHASETKEEHSKRTLAAYHANKEEINARRRAAYKAKKEAAAAACQTS